MRRAAVLGSPIEHSRSPVLHRAAYAELGLDWNYDAIAMDEGGLADFVTSRDDSWVGLSLTMPLKTAVLPLLDDSTDTVRLVEAANTVLFVDGRRIGHNTDVPGAVRSLEALQLAGARRATVIGGGATARSCLAALARVGVEEVAVVVRRLAAVADVRPTADRLGLHVEALAFDSDLRDALRREVVVSTVPGGAADGLAGQLPPRCGALLDVTYSPWPTGLAAAWESAGGRIASGFDLLLWQAVEQVELMTGRPAPIAAMRNALEAAR